MKTTNELFAHLLRVMQHDRFLQKLVPGNDIPFYICPYNPSMETEITPLRQSLIGRLTAAGIAVTEVNLFDAAVTLLRERGIWGRVIEIEAEHDKSEFKELLQSVLDPQDHLVPLIIAAIKTQPEILLISGVGEVFPFVRAHALLNNLQSAAGQQLTVMFFPGTYTHALASGATLDVLGLRQDDRYYRAINILEYQI